MDAATTAGKTRGRPATTMSEQERHGLIEWAWYYAQPILFAWNRSHPGLDYEGYVGERLTRQIDRFDAGFATLKAWSQAEASFACMDVSREDTGIIRVPLSARDKKVKAVTLSLLDFITESGRREPADCLAVWDEPGHLEQIGAFADLIRGTSKPERLLLLGYYWQGRTMKQIAGDLGVSESRISQMHTEILGRLREARRTA